MTALTTDDLIALGSHVAAMAGAMTAMGHDRPSSSTNYCDPGDGEMSRLVWSMFHADLSRDNDEALAFVHSFVERHGLLDVIAEQVAS